MAGEKEEEVTGEEAPDELLLDEGSEDQSTEESDSDDFRMCDVREVRRSISGSTSLTCSTPRKLINFLNFADCNVRDGPRHQSQLLGQTLPTWQLLTETRELRKLLAAVQEERKAVGQSQACHLSVELERTRAELQEKEQLLEALARSRDRAEQEAAMWQQVAMTPRLNDSEPLSPQNSPSTSEGSESLSLYQRRATPLSPRSDQKLQLPIKMPAADGAPGRIQVIFQLCCAETFLKEELLVVGDHPVLGSWKLEAAQQLQTSKSTYPKWQSRSLLSFPGDAALALRYKYVRDGRRSRRGGYCWEDLIPDRQTLILEPLPPGRAWLIRDIAFNYSEPPQVTPIELGAPLEAPQLEKLIKSRVTNGGAAA